MASEEQPSLFNKEKKNSRGKLFNKTFSGEQNNYTYT